MHAVQLGKSEGLTIRLYLRQTERALHDDYSGRFFKSIFYNFALIKVNNIVLLSPMDIET